MLNWTDFVAIESVSRPSSSPELPLVQGFLMALLMDEDGNDDDERLGEDSTKKKKRTK